MNKVDVGAYRIRPECVHLSLCMYSGVCDTPLRLIAAISCPRRGEAFASCDFVPTAWGSFRILRFHAHGVGKLSHLAISCPRRGEAFQPWDFVPAPWGSFPALGIRAHGVGKFSSFGIFSRSRDDVHIVSTFIAVRRQPVQADCPCRLVARSGRGRHCCCSRSMS